MPDADIQALRKPPAAGVGAADEFASGLVRSGALTDFQARTLLKGDGRTLVLGNYTVLDRLGAGGMGVVFKAQHRRMKRHVALKTLPQSAIKSEPSIKPFHREVEAAAQLSHPNIVTAFDADESKGIHFYVMEYVEGSDLSSLVKRNGPLPVDAAIDFILQVARGLAYAHSEGIIHRDIKPSNLLLAPKGIIKILDMGLVRIDVGKSEEHTELTGIGMVVGTINYMSPEQALDSKSADARADIYSLGATLNYLLTGRSMLPGSTPGEKMQALLARSHEQTVSLQAYRDDISAELERVFQKMVARDADQRYQTMTEVIEELQPFIAARDVGSTILLAARDSSAQVVGASGGLPGDSAIRRDPGVQTTVLPNPDPPRYEVAADTAHGNALEPTKDAPVAESQQPARQPVPRRPFNIALFLLVVAGLIAGSIIFWPQTRDGVLAIHFPREVAKDLIVEIDGEKAEIATTKGRAITVEIGPGNHNKLLITVDGVRLFTEADNGFEIDAGQELSIVARFEQVASDSHSQEPLVQTGDGLAKAPPPADTPFNAEQATTHQQAWAQYLGVPVEYENSIGMKFRLIPPGEFLMGSTEEELEEALRQDPDDEWWCENVKSEAPRHRVILTKPVYLGVHEVTQEQYRTVTGTSPSHFSPTGSGTEAVADMDTSEHPVETVSWYDAIDFCTKLSELEQVRPFYLHGDETVTMLEGTGYRLPTEAEWEFACRAGTTTKFGYGDSEEELVKAGWHEEISGDRTHAVGELNANPLGLFDMHGNVWEWCHDWHGAYENSVKVKDSLGATSGSSRVHRGGCLFLAARTCRAAYRDADDPSFQDDDLGFRVILSPLSQVSGKSRR